MVALSDVFDGWALDKRRSPEESAKILGWAESLRRLADEVCPEWNPPDSARLGVLGFMGRKVLDK